VTLKTIADAFGVSRTTVSNAYNRPEPLAPERPTHGPSNPNSLDAEVPAARAEPVDAAVARGAVATGDEEAFDALLALADEPLAAGGRVARRCR